jgi:hypothetical protein
MVCPPYVRIGSMPSQPPNSPLSIAFIVRDPLPPIRADVLTLFGAEMPRYGLAYRAGGAGRQRGTGSPWPAGGMHVVGSLRSRFASVCSPLWDLLGLWRAVRERRPDCLQVRDKIASGVLGRVMAALLRVPFVYWMSFPIVEGFEVRRDDIARQERGLKGRLKWAAHALRARASRFAIYRWCCRARATSSCRAMRWPTGWPPRVSSARA